MDPRLSARHISVPQQQQPERFGSCCQPASADVSAAGVPNRDDGVGLAAPQVGVSVRLMVFNPAGERGQGEELVLANPRIVSTSRKLELGEEGCLSFLKLNSRELILADVEVHIECET